MEQLYKYRANLGMFSARRNTVVLTTNVNRAYQYNVGAEPRTVKSHLYISIVLIKIIMSKKMTKYYNKFMFIVQKHVSLVL